MTNKLYLNDSYLLQCEAVVLACEPVENGFEVELDQTVLFPTGGGQPCDTGYIGQARVDDVFARGESVIHHTDSAFAVGTTVTVCVDEERRFDHMQQHSGEHMLSFAAHQLYGATNVGFHLAATYATIDLDTALSADQIAELELHTNRLLARNLPARLEYVTGEQAEQMPLRKHAKGLTGTIRLVLFEGGDSCTCCGTHVNYTGEIGPVKISSAENYKGGTRITFLCGTRALLHTQKMQATVDALAKQFSVKQDDVLEAVERLQKELSAAKQDNKKLQAQMTKYILAELLEDGIAIKDKKLIVHFFEQGASVALKTLAQELTKKEKVVALLLDKTEAGLQYQLACTKDITLDMGEISKVINASIPGAKGGGRGQLAQGNAPMPQGMPGVVEQFTQYLKSRMAAL